MTLASCISYELDLPKSTQYALSDTNLPHPVFALVLIDRQKVKYSCLHQKLQTHSLLNTNNTLKLIHLIVTMLGVGTLFFALAIAIYGVTT